MTTYELLFMAAHNLFKIFIMKNRFDEYKEYVGDSINDVPIKNELEGLMGLTGGLVTESSEVFDIVRKKIYFGKDIDRLDLIMEMGDLLFFFIGTAKLLDIDVELISDINRRKLELRYPMGRNVKYGVINKEKEKETILKEFGHEYNFKKGIK